ncbi:MAG: prephenate dehydrogenase/arogenate dehydrogenase family protein [Gammaproteobacteria bacterium]|jgi:chorismate mutase/prephenate dehydrogenase
MSEEKDASIASLRERLTAIDHRILELVAQRQALVEEIGRSKRSRGQQTRDFSREKDVIQDAVAFGGGLGLSAEMVETLMTLLIRSSLTTQEQHRVVAEGRGGGRTALIIGGGGRMGRWFADFLDSQGYRVSIADPSGAGAPYPARQDWRDGDLKEDMIVVAAPLVASGQILEELARLRPPGLVFDIGSLKTPLRAGLGALAAAGCRVASLHPMFGPDTRLLSGRHVIIVDAGCPEANREVSALFEATMAERVEMSLQEHDRLMAFVLGLSHALNIAFFTALADSGEDVPHLAALSSTTFDAQLDVCSKVAGENPELYFEIQSLNAHGVEALVALEHSVTRLNEIIRSRDQAGFVTLMERGRDYLERRRGAQ